MEIRKWRAFAECIALVVEHIVCARVNKRIAFVFVCAKAVDANAGGEHEHPR